MGNKRKGKENVGLLLNGTGDLMAKDTEKAEVPSLPQSLLVSPAFRPLRPGGKTAARNTYPHRRRIRLGNKLDIQSHGA